MRFLITVLLAGLCAPSFAQFAPGQIHSNIFVKLIPADYDNDGDIDFIKGIHSTGTLVFQENIDRGVFAADDTIGSGAMWWGDTADVNKDGFIDFVYSTQGGIFILKNQGDKTFVTDTVSTSLSEAVHLKIGDIDSDGDMDIAVCTRIERIIAWQENINSGESWVQHIIATVGSNSDGLDLTDMNGDGQLDVLTVEYNGPVKLHLNLGNGTFDSGTTIANLNKPVDVVGADFDNDGDKDILVGAYNSNSIVLYENSGNTTFKSSVTISTSAMGIRRMIIDDIDLDGDLDILGFSEFDDQFFIHENLGNGIFTPEIVIASHDFPIHYTVADIDNDNDKEVFVGYWNAGKSYYYKNLTKGGIKVKGQVLFDEVDACNGTRPVANLLVTAQPGNYIAITDSLGRYELLLDTGSYNLSPVFALSAEALIVDSCEAFKSISSNTGILLSDQDFGYQVKNCSALEVQLTSSRRRRCFTSNTTVTYENFGFNSATNAKLEIHFPTYVRPLTSSITPSVFTDTLLIFDLGNVAPGESHTITIQDSVVCGIEEIRGLTQCTRAVISEGSCQPQSQAWDKSSIVVSGKCNSNQNLAQFSIKNGGDGNMLQQSEFRVYYNDTLVMKEMFQLNSGKELILNVPAYGQTIRVEADQHPEHPGYSRPREIIEACGSSLENAFRGYILSVPQDDIDEFIDVECLEIIDSYDPNDKLSSPQTYVESYDFLEYTIRFQNTGSDTAFKVLVIDTLSSNLDVNTLELLNTSHPCNVKMDEDNGQHILSWNFQNINLPDSTTNEAESHGFIKFRIKPQDLPDGTQIFNKAYIFFDYNSAIITNDVLVTIGYPEITDFSKAPEMVITGVVPYNTGLKSVLLVTPNPLNQSGKITGLPENSKGTFTIYSAEGRIMNSSSFNSEINIDSQDLKPGIYFYKVLDDEGNTYNGAFAVQN